MIATIGLHLLVEDRVKQFRETRTVAGLLALLLIDIPFHPLSLHIRDSDLMIIAPDLVNDKV